MQQNRACLSSLIIKLEHIITNLYCNPWENVVITMKRTFAIKPSVPHPPKICERQWSSFRNSSWNYILGRLVLGSFQSSVSNPWPVGPVWLRTAMNGPDTKSTNPLKMLEMFCGWYNPMVVLERKLWGWLCGVAMSKVRYSYRDLNVKCSPWAHAFEHLVSAGSAIWEGPGALGRWRKWLKIGLEALQSFEVPILHGWPASLLTLSSCLPQLSSLLPGALSL